MYDDVSHALHTRLYEPEGLKATLLVSSAAHVLLMVAVVMAPASWWQRSAAAPRDVMTISLGPTPGPRTEGMTSMGSAPAREVVPEVSTPPPARRPAATTREMPPEMTTTETTTAKVTAPEMTAPVMTAPVKTAPPEEPRVAAETGSGGLRAGGGGITAGRFNVGEFCCPEYIATMLQRIEQNWSSRQGSGGVTTMKFTIQRDGTLTDIQVARSSANQTLDFLAQRALLAVRQLSPLPAEYPHPTLVVNLDFESQR
jgi:periplasmic protein TonB